MYSEFPPIAVLPRPAGPFKAVRRAGSATRRPPCGLCSAFVTVRAHAATLSRRILAAFGTGSCRQGLASKRNRTNGRHIAMLCGSGGALGAGGSAPGKAHDDAGRRAVVDAVAGERRLADKVLQLRVINDHLLARALYLPGRARPSVCDMQGFVAHRAICCLAARTTQVNRAECACAQRPPDFCVHTVLGVSALTQPRPAWCALIDLSPGSDLSPGKAAPPVPPCAAPVRGLDGSSARQAPRRGSLKCRGADGRTCRPGGPAQARARGRRSRLPAGARRSRRPRRWVLPRSLPRPPPLTRRTRRSTSPAHPRPRSRPRCSPPAPRRVTPGRMQKPLARAAPGAARRLAPPGPNARMAAEPAHGDTRATLYRAWR